VCCSALQYAGRWLTRPGRSAPSVTHYNSCNTPQYTATHCKVAKMQRVPHFTGRVPKKSSVIHGCFEDRDIQLKKSYASSPPCTTQGHHMCTQALQHTVVYCNKQHTTIRYNTLQFETIECACNALQHTVAYSGSTHTCNKLQYTTTHYNSSPPHSV